MRRAAFASLVLAAALMTASPRASGDDRATELLERARAALGGPALAKVTSFQAEGTYRRQVGDRQIDGDLEIAVELPGRFLRTETITMGGETMGRRYVGLNGEESLDAMVGGPGGGNFIMRAPPGVAPEQAQAMMRRRTQREFVRTVLGFLLTAPDPAALQFTYGGEAESPDGKADVLDVAGPDNFAVELFLDQNTGRPLMLAFREPQPRIMSMRRGEGPPPSREEIERRVKEAQAQPARLVDVQEFLGDYREERGVMMPHRIQRSVDGQAMDELTLESFNLAPKFKADKFTKK